MKNALLIVGAGGHGKVAAETALAAGWNSVVFLDDRVEELQESFRWPVKGSVSDAVNLLDSYADAIVAVGHAETRLQLIRQLSELGFHLPALVHPSAWVSPSAELGMGSVVFANAAVNAEAELGRGVIVNTGATVDHDCVIDDGVHICPGVHLAGEVSVGRGSWIGIGSCVIQQLRIGERVTVGAGSAVVRSVEDGERVAGVPAQMIGSNAEEG